MDRRLTPLRPPPAVIFSSRWLEVHLAFVVSATAIAFIDRLMENVPAKPAHATHGEDYKKTA